MKKKQMPLVLFSCAGTTDPIRGEHDGPLLHIMRYYRPETVFVFITQEILKRWQEIDCENRLVGYLKEKLDGYSPEIAFFSSNVADPSDLDALENDMLRAFQDCRLRFPTSETLINISSGTAQMQIILSQLALDGRYRTKAVQVKNYERRAGTSVRINDKQNYDFELEMECNEDDQPEARNRCVEPAMYPILRNTQKAQILGLLEMRDFVALRNLKESIPEDLYPLVCHLAERSLLHPEEAYKIFGNISEDQLGFELYPEYELPRGCPTDPPVSFREAVEYAMLFRNLHKSERYTEFLIRMEPLTRNLQVALADRLLWADPGYHCRLKEFVDIHKGAQIFNPDKMSRRVPSLFAQLQSNMNDQPQFRELSTWLMDKLIKSIGNVPQPCSELFSLYENIKGNRNSAAHELAAFTEADLCAVAGRNVNEIIRIIESATAAVFPQCNPVRFNVYDKCVRYIKDKL